MYYSSQIRISLIVTLLTVCTVVYLNHQPSQSQSTQPIFTPTTVAPPPDPFLITAESMSIEEKIRQVLICGYSGTDIQVAIAKSEICGNFIIFEQNLTGLSETQIIRNHSILHHYDNLVWILIDQEGGKVSRIIDNIPSARVIEKAKAAALLGEYHGLLLSKLLIDVNLAPVADIATHSSVIGTRSFGDTKEAVSLSVSEYITSLQNNHVIAVAKHLPGQGKVSTDTHYETGILNTSWNEVLNSELVPFINAINSGIEMFMVGHIIIPSLDTKPASLSPIIVSELRGSLPHGPELIFITDSLSMAGVATDSSQAAILALKAGEDMVLISGLPEDKIFPQIKLAYEQGFLDQNRLNQSVAKILKLKAKFGKPRN